MTYREWYVYSREMLEKAGCDSPAFDAVCMIEDIGGLPRGGYPMWEKKEIPAASVQKLEDALRQRTEGRPLQYILGEWAFLNLSLEVGEGVLIPRPDTECLCLTGAEYLTGVDSPSVLDLCAGSGCVSLGIASLVPGARVVAAELSGEALFYLRRNISRYPAYDVTPLEMDICQPPKNFPGGFHAILSNPPYIPTEELPGLMREVRREPMMALDGGEDGLRFYRVIAKQWIPRLLPGGLCAVEVGQGQATQVADLFSAVGLREITIRKDLAGIERVVAGIA